MARNSKKYVVLSLIVLVLSLLTLSTVFLPIMSKSVLAIGETIGDAVVATGKDVFAVAFSGELKPLEILELSNGAQLLYSLKTADATSLLTNIMMYAYLATLVVAGLAIIFAILTLLGVKAKGLNVILGICLIVLSIATVVLAFIVSGKATSLEEGVLTGKQSGILTAVSYGMYVLATGLIAGLCNLLKARD